MRTDAALKESRGFVAGAGEHATVCPRHQPEGYHMVRVVRNRLGIGRFRRRLYFAAKGESNRMSSETIYAKTQKGFEEMARRTYRLPARMRSLLIMIDGRLPAGELFARAPHPEE